MPDNFDMIECIAFDADDTLWVNETFFRDAEKSFCDLLADYASKQDAMSELTAMELGNMPIYGYGIKPFTLSLIEAAIKISNGQVSTETIGKVIDIGKNMLGKPVELLPDVEQVLQQLHTQFRLVVATKGDLLDQERKLRQSGLEKYFHHIEVVSDKTPDHYRKLVRHLDLPPEKFLMVGNSIKSDILPVLEAGSFAIHIPFHTTWSHEVAEPPTDHPRFKALARAADLLPLLLVY